MALRTSIKTVLMLKMLIPSHSTPPSRATAVTSSKLINREVFCSNLCHNFFRRPGTPCTTARPSSSASAKVYKNHSSPSPPGSSGRKRCPPPSRPIIKLQPISSAPLPPSPPFTTAPTLTPSTSPCSPTPCPRPCLILPLARWNSGAEAQPQGALRHRLLQHTAHVACGQLF